MRVLLLLLLTGVAFADASVGSAGSERLVVPPGTHRGQLGLRYGFHEGGVGALIWSQYNLELELVTTRTTVELRARGNGERTTTYVIPPDGPQPKPADKSSWTVASVFVGEFSGNALRLRDKDGDTTQEMRCTIQTVVVSTGPIRVLQCDPATLRKGFPWSDRVAPFLRVPLIVALNGKVRAEISTMVTVSSEQAQPLRQISIQPAR
jgi:hypothetical protein